MSVGPLLSPNGNLVQHEEWVDYIFGGEAQGYVYVMLLKGGKPGQSFFKWPEQRDKLLQMTKHKQRGDVYFCPSLFKSKSGTKDAVLGSYVSWADIDHPLKTYPEELPPPGLVISSGTEGRSHRYWRATEFQDIKTTEGRNVYLQQSLRGDPSGWDANQLLRIPDTLNHKTTTPRPVTIRSFEQGEFNIPTSDRAEKLRADYELLPVDQVLVERGIPKKVRSLYLTGSSDRSSGLMRLAFELSENGWNPDEVYTLLSHADSRWGKFSKRDDKQLRLSEIVGRSILTVSFEYGSEEGRRDNLTLKGWRTLRASKSTINWIYEGFLRERGFVVIAGTPGVGKSTFAIQSAASIVLQLDFLKMKAQGRPQRVLLASHEMDDSELDYIMEHQTGVLTEPQLDMLEERVVFRPVGYALHLDDPAIQEEYETLIEDGEFTGFIIDSLNASVATSLKDDVVVRKIFDWIDKIRQQYGIWVILITHPRKAPSNAKNYEQVADDVYGDSIIIQRPNTVAILSKTRSEQVKLNYVKARQKQTTEPVFLDRTQHMWFTVGEEKDPPKQMSKVMLHSRGVEPAEELEVSFDVDYED